ncbi:MAG: VapE domain-containing protein [Paraprevotella clara]
MQLSALNLRKAYRRHSQALPRIASFIGTSNSRELLSDPSGSRRFICVLVEHPIDCTGIDHAQIYAQLKAELENGERYWFSHGEENALRLHNAAFYRICPAGRYYAATIVRLNWGRRYGCFRCPKYSHGCGGWNPERWQA